MIWWVLLGVYAAGVPAAVRLDLYGEAEWCRRHVPLLVWHAGGDPVRFVLRHDPTRLWFSVLVAGLLWPLGGPLASGTTFGLRWSRPAAVTVDDVAGVLAAWQVGR